MKSPVRLIEPELLDHAPEREAASSLADLRRINSLLGGYATLRKTLRARFETSEPLSFLDVGAASGDMGRAFLQSFPKGSVTSLDYSRMHLQQGAGSRVQADAFRMPFAPASFDIVFCSLFLHHFPDEQVVELLANFRRAARRGVAVIDLERHPLAWKFVPATRWLFGWHPLTLHDAPVSVQAGFQAAELQQLAHAAGLSGIQVKKHRPWFRLSLWAPCD